jgi:hypothetical protein
MDKAQSQADVNFVLETINGSVSILLIVAIAFFVRYLVDQRRLRGLSWREMVLDPPPGINLALPMLVIKVGMLLSRGTLWIWRQFGGGVQMPAWQLDATVLGTAITSLGLLWLLRVLTRGMFGNRVWIVTACVVLLYIAVNSVDHYFS